MTDCSLVCPDCGAIIVLVYGSNPGSTVAQISAQISSNGESEPGFEQGVEVQDLKPGTSRAKAYNQGYNQDFLAFWRVYPRRTAKRKAQQAWLKAVRRLGSNPGSNAESAKAQILAGAIRLRDDPNRTDQFTPYAERWLNSDGWEDEPLPPRQPSLGWLDETYRRATHGGP